MTDIRRFIASSAAALALALTGCAFPTNAGHAGQHHRADSGTNTRNDTMQDDTTQRRSTSTKPMTLEEFELLKKSVLFDDDDVAALRRSHDILKPQVEQILDVWYGFVGSSPHLVRYFAHRETGEPSAEYLAAVRVRFAQWVLDTARADYDQDWLDNQDEIGLRHHSTKKNTTDGVDSVPIIHFRYLPALVYPITATLKPFLAKSGRPASEVDAMHQAWIKSVLLQSILWSRPYVHDGEY